jgi:FMN phosphatase YigB (HAD superfamily)
MIKAIIFDFFGVIVGDGFEFTYREAGGDPVKDREFILDLLDKTNRGLITTDEFRKRICDKLKITVSDYQEALKKSEIINQTLLDYIKKELRPKYKTAILSNVNKGGLERRVKKEVLDEYFDVIVVSADVGYIKPEAEIYQLTAAKLGVKTDECVFIDDREGYVSAAALTGMKAIYYQDFTQMKDKLQKFLAADADN